MIDRQQTVSRHYVDREMGAARGAEIPKPKESMNRRVRTIGGTRETGIKVLDNESEPMNSKSQAGKRA
jgi:hypothetical protein